MALHGRLARHPGLQHMIGAIDGYEQMRRRPHKQGESLWYSGKKETVRWPALDAADGRMRCRD